MDQVVNRALGQLKTTTVTPRTKFYQMLKINTFAVGSTKEGFLTIL